MHDLVIDTNVLVSALRSRRGASWQLLRLIDSGVFRFHISPALALEYEDVLQRTDLIPAFTAQDTDRFLDYLFHAGVLVPSVNPLRPLLPDPGDEFVAELAVQAHATVITYNKKDFAALSHYGLSALTPAEFLDLLRKIR